MFIYIFVVLQSTATCIAASRYASATPVPPSVLSRGIGWLVIIEVHIPYATVSLYDKETKLYPIFQYCICNVVTVFFFLLLLLLL